MDIHVTNTNEVGPAEVEGDSVPEFSREVEDLMILDYALRHVQEDVRRFSNMPKGPARTTKLSRSMKLLEVIERHLKIAQEMVVPSEALVEEKPVFNSDDPEVEAEIQRSEYDVTADDLKAPEHVEFNDDDPAE